MRIAVVIKFEKELFNLHTTFDDTTFDDFSTAS